MAVGSRASTARSRRDPAAPAGGAGARVVVYGLSTEGYRLAKPMAVAGADVWIVDESTPSAIELKPEVAKTYPDVHSLRTDEPLLSLVPIDTAISRAQYLFFAPRLRAGVDDHGAELTLKLKDAVAKLPRNSSIVYCLPVGLGDNADHVALVEHTTGYEAGAGVGYYYYPLGGPAGEPDVIGSAAVPAGSAEPPGGAADEVLACLLAAGDGREREVVSLKSAESVHALRVLSHFTSVHSMLEVYRLARGKLDNSDRGGGAPLAAEYDSVFVDEMVAGMYDLMMVYGTLEHSSTVLSQINSSAKAVVNYKKYVVDTVRRIVRSSDLRASKTRVVVSWRFDPRMMRIDKAKAAGMLAEMLHDHITDVELHNWFDADAALPPAAAGSGAAGSVYRSDKTIILVACTEADLDEALEHGEDRDMIIVKANAACEAFDMLSTPHAGQGGERRLGKTGASGAAGRRPAARSKPRPKPPAKRQQL